MKYWLKLFVTIALAISIPLQGIAGVTMPACKMSQDTMSVSMVMNTANHEVMMSQPVVKAANCDMKDKNCCDVTGNKTCSDQKCAICHVSLLQLPVTGLFTVPEILATVYPDLIIDDYQTFPPGMFHPPKPLLS